MCLCVWRRRSTPVLSSTKSTHIRRSCWDEPPPNDYERKARPAFKAKRISSGVIEAVSLLSLFLSLARSTLVHSSKDMEQHPRDSGVGNDCTTTTIKTVSNAVVVCIQALNIAKAAAHVWHNFSATLLCLLVATTSRIIPVVGYDVCEKSSKRSEAKRNKIHTKTRTADTAFHLLLSHVCTMKLLSLEKAVVCRIFRLPVQLLR